MDETELAPRVRALGHTVTIVVRPDEVLAATGTGSFDLVLVGDGATPLPLAQLVARVQAACAEAEVVYAPRQVALPQVLEAFQAGVVDCVVRELSGGAQNDAEILRRKLAKALGRVHGQKATRQLLEELSADDSEPDAG